MKDNGIKNRVLSENFEVKNLDKLFEFLRLHRDFSFTVRNERVIIYCCGRKALEIIPHRNYYTFAFNFNTATNTLIKDQTYVDNAIHVLVNDLGFPKELEVKYIEWREKRLIYSQSNRRLKNNYKKTNLRSVNFDIKGKIARISKDKATYFDYEKYFEWIGRLCQDCSIKRPEEAVKQLFVNYYTNINDEYCIFDSEFEPSFCNEKAKKELEKCFGKFVHPDLVALKKEGTNVKVVFIELKCLIKSMNGKKADVIEHINDAISYKTLYEQETDQYQKQSFKKYIEYTLKLKSDKGLLQGTTEKLNALLSRIDYDKAPELIILCAIKNNEPQIKNKYQLAKYLKKSNSLLQLHNNIKKDGDINYEFICGNESINTLLCPKFKTNLKELLKINYLS